MFYHSILVYNAAHSSHCAIARVVGVPPHKLANLQHYYDGACIFYLLYLHFGVAALLVTLLVTITRIRMHTADAQRRATVLCACVYTPL